MVAGLGRHRLPGVERDVRRVADDHVDLPSRSSKAVGHVAEAQVDPGAGQVAGRPARARPRRARRRAPGRAAPRRPPPSAIAPEPVQRSTTTGARPAAPRVPSIAQPASSSVSGRGTNTPGPDLELDVAEGGRAGQVLQRLAGGPPRDQRVVRLDAGARRRRRRRSGSRPSAVPEHVGQQLGGVALGRGDPGLAQPLGGRPPQRPADAAHCSSASSRAGEVGLDARWRPPASRSPSSTWSRL